MLFPELPVRSDNKMKYINDDKINEFAKLISEILTMKQIRDLNIFFGKKRKTIIYGAGKTGKVALGFLKRYGVDVDFFLDQQASKIQYIDDVPVYPPESKYTDRDANVIIAIFNHNTDVNLIADFLINLGFHKLLTFTELYIGMAEVLPDQYWLGTPMLYKSHVKELAKVFGLLKDQISRDLFLSLLRFRITGDPKYSPIPQSDEIYFPDNILKSNGIQHFIDCGAFTGDTLTSLKAKYGTVRSIRAFEPDQENFKKLKSINQKNSFSKDTRLYPYAVWSSEAQKRFSSESSASSSIDKSGERNIQCVSIDNILRDYTPTYLKMDVEGSELEALKGAENKIISAKPFLAISLYHTPEHLWQIPLYIKSIEPSYKFYIRVHGFNGYDIVLYAHV